jgi:hypothetical protein
MTRKNIAIIETPSIVLKTIHDDILNANANATITTKQMRIWLRANMRDVHVHNASWLFTQSQYDVVRAQFDVAYRAKIERAMKRETRSHVAPRKCKSKSIDVVVEVVNDDTSNVDA